MFRKRRRIDIGFLLKFIDNFHEDFILSDTNMNRKREDLECQEQDYNRLGPMPKKIKSPTLSTEKFNSIQINDQLRSKNDLTNEMKFAMIGNLPLQQVLLKLYPDEDLKILKSSKWELVFFSLTYIFHIDLIKIIR